MAMIPWVEHVGLGFGYDWSLDLSGTTFGIRLLWGVLPWREQLEYVVSFSFGAGMWR